MACPTVRDASRFGHPVGARRVDSQSINRETPKMPPICWQRALLEKYCLVLVLVSKRQALCFRDFLFFTTRKNMFSLSNIMPKMTLFRKLMVMHRHFLKTDVLHLLHLFIEPLRPAQSWTPGSPFLLECNSVIL